jgi:hypothetical protein
MSDDKNYIDFDDNENDNIEIESCDDINNIEQDDNDIDEEFIDFDDVNDIEEDNNFDILHRFNTNKHKQEGKHSLKRDTIFKGKKDDKNEDMSQSDDSYYDNINIFEIQYNENDDIISSTDLTKDVYDILDEKTDIDFKQNRRKPNKDSFNNYYNLLVKELGYRYTRSEIFVELSYYFTDNIFNMFKLLDKKPAMNIIKELTQKGFLKNLDGINFL